MLMISFLYHCLIISGFSLASTSSDPNFQATSLRERNAAMLNNELMADVYFVVGPTG